MNALHAGTPTCDTGRMARRTSRFPRVYGLVLAVAVVAASCSDDDTTSDVESAISEAADEVTEQPPDPAGDDGDDSGGAATATGTLEVSGAIQESVAEADDTVAFRAGGGCFDGTFAMSVKVDVDGRTRYDVIVPELAGVDGNTIGEFTTDVELHYIDPEIEGFDTEVFAGQGTVTIVGQDPDVRAFAYEVDGSLTSEDDDSRSVDVDYAYTASIIC